MPEKPTENDKQLWVTSLRLNECSREISITFLLYFWRGQESNEGSAKKLEYMDLMEAI